MERSAQILGYYAEIARLSAGMLDAARNGQWDDLGVLESLRAGQVAGLKDAIANGDTPRDIAQEVAQLITKTMAADAETLSLAGEWKGELQELLSSIGTEKKLARTYGR